MSVKIDAALLCDQVRQENNGKLIAIGIYSAQVVFASFPSIVQFFILSRMITDEPGQHEFKFRVKVGEEVIQEGEGQLEVATGQADWLPIPLQPIQFLVPATLSAEYEAAPGDWTSFFNIKITRAAISNT